MNPEVQSRVFALQGLYIPQFDDCTLNLQPIRQWPKIFGIILSCLAMGKAKGSL